MNKNKNLKQQEIDALLANRPDYKHKATQETISLLQKELTKRRDDLKNKGDSESGSYIDWILINMNKEEIYISNENEQTIRLVLKISANDSEYERKESVFVTLSK